MRSVLLISLVCVAPLVFASPVPQDASVISTDPAQATALLPANPSKPMPPAVTARGGNSLVAPPTSSRPGPPGNRSDDPIGEGAAGGRQPVDRAAIPRRSASSVPLEEDPQVELTDVVRSVVVTAAGSIPWLRFGSRDGTDDKPKARSRAPADAAPGERIPFDSFGMSGRAAGRSDDEPAAQAGSAGASNLLRETIQSVRDAARHPLTWLLLLLLMLGVFTAYALGRRGEK